MREFFQQTIIKNILRYALFGFLALLLQNMLLTQTKIFGVYPMILPAAVVAVGMFEGPAFGALFGLIIGIFADMAFVENTILFTVLFSAIGFFSAFMADFYINKRFVAFLVMALIAGLITAAFQMIKCMLSDEFSLSMLKTMLVQTAVSVPFSALAFPLPDGWNK